MAETLGLLAIMMIGYLIYTNWSTICTIFGIIVGVFVLYQIGKIVIGIYDAVQIDKERKRKAEEERWEQEQKDIKGQIDNLLQGTQEHKYQELNQYLHNLTGRSFQYAKNLLQESKKKIHSEMISDLCNGRYEAGMERILVLKQLVSSNESAGYDDILKKANEWKKIGTDDNPYILTGEYGKLRADLLSEFDKVTPEIMRANMEKYGVLKSLWYFTFKYDHCSYLVPFQVLQSMKTRYNNINVDALMSLMYLEKKYGVAYVEKNIFQSYTSVKNRYILGAGKTALKNLASFANYIGDKETEQECLKRMNQ